jgi:hypothetical protein
VADLLKQPVAWRREWDGDVSDEGHWLYTEDEADTKDGHTWQPLFLDPPSEADIRAGLELFKRIRDESAPGVAPTVEVIGYIHKEWEPSQGQGRIYGHQPGPDYKAVTAAAGVDLPDGAKR